MAANWEDKICNMKASTFTTSPKLCLAFEMFSMVKTVDPARFESIATTTILCVY